MIHDHRWIAAGLAGVLGIAGCAKQEPDAAQDVRVLRPEEVKTTMGNDAKPAPVAPEPAAESPPAEQASPSSETPEATSAESSK